MNIFDSLEDAPPPSKELKSVYVDEGDGWFTHYIARDGAWIRAGRIYPAKMD